MRHLITGGAGFVGSALARRLVKKGHEVVVLDRMSRGKHERLPVGVGLIEADIRDSSAVMRGVDGADVIWHLAYVQGTQTFYAEPKDVIEIALTGMMNVLVAVEHSVRRPEYFGGPEGKKPDLFLVSSSEVYQNPPEGMYPTDETVPLSVPDVTNPRYSYGGGKIASELATLAYAQAGLLNRAVIVRPHNIYGPDMGHEHVIPEFAERMMERIRTGNPEFKIQGSGRETRSFCYIDDCVDGLMVLLENAEDRQVYHLGNPAEEHAIAGVASQIASWFGCEIDIVSGVLPKGSPTRRAPDIGKMRALGFEPKWGLREGLAETLPWYASNSSAIVAA
jgi:nucleoside-diphosphate-sugar epimerase